MILPQLWVGQEVGEGGQWPCALPLIFPPLLSLLPPPPPSKATGMKPPPGWGRGRGEVGGEEGGGESHLDHSN